MKKLLLVTLDERPCCFEFQAQMARGTDIQIVKPPRELLPDKKKFADPDKLYAWMEENAEGCDGCVLAIDALLYSGLLPSRIHNFSLETLKERHARIRTFKENHPGMLLYAYSTIMRNPRYSSSEQEPDYYEEWGHDIHRWGWITHRKDMNVADPEELEELDAINARLPKEFLDDYLGRRAKNTELNKMTIDLAAEGVIDFLIIPQDDSSPYGLTALDQRVLRKYIREKKIQLKAYMYPDSDGVQGTLVARMANHFENRKPLIWIKYASAAGDTVVPMYEDRMVDATVKYQILACGGIVASSAAEADLIVMVNTPSANPRDRLSTPEFVNRIEYDANRNQIELVEYAAYAIDVLKKPVCFLDIAFANGGDPELFWLLREKGLLWKLAGYSGWNTSSNAIGIALPSALLYLLYGARPEHVDFLAMRYVEDVAYMDYIRPSMLQNEIPAMGLSYFKVDGENGEVAKIIKAKLQAFADENISDDEYRIVIDHVYMPWTRMFNNGIFAHAEPVK